MRGEARLCGLERIILFKDHDALAPVMGRIAACGRDARAPCLSPPISRLTSSRIAACGRDARAPCLSLPISGLTSSRIAACGRDARAPRRAGDAPQCPAVAEPNLPRTQACCRWGHGMPCPNTPERPQVAPAEIYPIDRFDSTRTRCAIPTVNCSALRCCGRAVPESANPPLPQRFRAHVRYLPAACLFAFFSVV